MAAMTKSPPFLPAGQDTLDGMFYMTTPAGNKWELRLSPDGSSLSGTREVGGMHHNVSPRTVEIELKRK